MLFVRDAETLLARYADAAPHADVEVGGARRSLGALRDGKEALETALAGANIAGTAGTDDEAGTTSVGTEDLPGLGAAVAAGRVG